MPRSSTGLTIIIAGGVLILVGLLVWSGALSWFGRLPGDVRVERTNSRFYMPITSMVLISIALSVAMALFRRYR